MSLPDSAPPPARRPQVALLTREFPPEVYGGAGVHVEHLAVALTHHVDVAVHCFGQPRSSPLVAGAYRPWDALEGDAPPLSALRTVSVDLRMAAAAEDADLVHSHTWYTNLAGHFAKLLHGIPHVVTSHSLEPLRPWKREQLGGGYDVAAFCERTAVEAADAVVAVSAGMRADMLACYPAVDPDRVEVIHNGVDADAYRPHPGTDALLRHGIDADRPCVVFVGRVTRQKGLPYLLDAAEHLDRDVQLVLCAGEPDTPQIAAEVRDHVERLRGGRHGIVWIEQMLDRADVVQILSHASVFVCPSVYEPFGLVNLEAMACEAPVVATATGGVPEIVVDGETGRLVPFEPSSTSDGGPADRGRFALDLAAAIRDVLSDPARAAAMGRAGRQRVLERFTWGTVAVRTAALYRRLLAG
ncbi:MAG TPA: glycogen synthase [Nitriliruptorales bacterium]|nr:glycogen synthase [Nitriliruptorales bacterium]